MISVLLVKVVSGYIIGSVAGKVLSRSMSHMDRTEVHFQKIEDDLFSKQLKEANNGNDFGVFKIDDNFRGGRF